MFPDLFLTAALLVPCLDANRFLTRHAAHEALQAHGELAGPALDWGTQVLGPEGRHRCDQLLDVLRPGRVEALLRRHDGVMIRIDALPLDYPNRSWLIDLYGCQLQPEWFDWAEGQHELDPPYQAGTRLLVLDLFDQGTPYADVADLLERMAARQVRHWQDKRWTDEDP